MNLPLISVILPIYNVENELPRCLDSICAQTYTNFEAVLVDDGSPDGCGAICDRYAEKDPRFKVIHRENGGVSAARNTGVDNASGELISFIDPDDYVEPDFLEFLYDLMTQNNADISACGALEIYKSGKTSLQWEDQTLYVMDSREALCRMCYNQGFYITLWDKLYKKEVFRGVRFPEGKLFEDTGTAYKLVDNANTVAVSCVPKYYYVLKDNSITTSHFKMSKLDYVEMADNMAEYIINKYPELETAARRKQMHACFSTLTQLVNSGVKNRPVEKMLTDRIRLLEHTALADPKTPKRDRIAIYALRLGYPFFSFVWRLYFKVKKG